MMGNHHCLRVVHPSGSRAGSYLAALLECYAVDVLPMFRVHPVRLTTAWTV